MLRSTCFRGCRSPGRPASRPPKLQVGKVRSGEAKSFLPSHRWWRHGSTHHTERSSHSIVVIHAKGNFVPYPTFYSRIATNASWDEMTSFLELCSKENLFSNPVSIYLRWLNIKSIHSRGLFPDPAMHGGRGKVFLCKKPFLDF